VPALRHVEIERQHLVFKLCNQPFERGDFRFQHLDALLQFDIRGAPRLGRALDLERNADLVWPSPFNVRAQSFLLLRDEEFDVVGNDDRMLEDKTSIISGSHAILAIPSAG